jgi:hypothetical protein
VSRPPGAGEQPPLGATLEPLHGVRVLRSPGPDDAIVLMSPEAAEELARRRPELSIELDARHRPAAAR